MLLYILKTTNKAAAESLENLQQKGMKVMVVNHENNFK